MRAVVVCSMNEVEFALELIGLIPEIDQSSFVDPMVFDEQGGLQKLPDVVITVLDTNHVDVKQENSAVQVTKFLSKDSVFHPLAIVVGNGSLSAETAGMKWSFIHCPDRTEESIRQASLIVSDLLSEEAKTKYFSLAEGSVDAMGGTRRLIADALRLFAALLIGALPIAATSAYERELVGALKDIFPSAVAYFIFYSVGMVARVVSLVAMFWLSFPVLRRLLHARDDRMRREESLEAMRYSKRLRRVVSYEADGDESTTQRTGVRKVDALERMLVNLEDIKQYYTWSQDQARSAFQLSRWLCIGGFALLAVATFLPPFLGMGWEASIIPAVGGAVTELVAGTALFVYKNSVSQLNYYHEALHEDERFLSSVSLVDRFETAERRDEILSEIVRSELAMNLGSVRTGAGNKKAGEGASGKDAAGIASE